MHRAETPDLPITRRQPVLWGFALVVLGLALHLPFLDRPFGHAEFNAGMACGVFARNFERHGFAALRGVPIGHQVLDDAARYAVPYLNHPPGGYWVFGMFGSDEWQLRLPTSIAHVLAAVILMLLLRRRVGPLRANLAGLTMLVMPVLLLDGQVAHEPLLLALGLAMFLAVERRDTGVGGPFPSAVIVGAALAGPWIDWGFGFFCLGLIPLCWSRDICTTGRRLCLPWTVAAASLVLVLVWREWALGAELLRATPAATALDDLAVGAIFERPDLRVLLDAGWYHLQRAYTAPLVLVAVIGLVPLFRSAPRLATALVVAGLPTPLLFPKYTITETHYVALLAPLVAAAAAVLAFRTRVLAALVVGLAGFVAVRAVARIGEADTTVFRDFGRAVTTAAVERGLDGTERRFLVASNFHARYGYYIDADAFWPFPVRDPGVIETARGADDGVGLRYVWLEFAPHEGPPIPEFATPAPLARYLEGFPRRRLPELRAAFFLPHYGRWIELRDAWLVTIES